jgi:hypothetical protein
MVAQTMGAPDYSPSFRGYDSNLTIDAKGEAGQLSRPAPSHATKDARGILDQLLLTRAVEIVDSFEGCDVIDASVNLESLRGIVSQLWNSAIGSSRLHQDILAGLESAILSIEAPTLEQLSVIREALIDLGQKVLTQAHVEIIRSQFVSRGFSPLAILSDMEVGEDGE